MRTRRNRDPRTGTPIATWPGVTTPTRANAFTMSSFDSSFEEPTLCDDISSHELTLPDSEMTAVETEEDLYVDPTPLSLLPQPLIDEEAERDAAELRRIIAAGRRRR